MKIVWHKNFKKHYKKRIIPHKNIDTKFIERVSLFIENPQNPILKDHQLTGKKKNIGLFG